MDENSGLKFEVTAVGEANTVKVITNGLKTPYSGTTYTVPGTVNYNNVDFAVTEIGQNAFSECSSLESITLSEGLLTIGQQAFGSCTSLQSITFPASVTTIGRVAFYGCTSLTSVTFLGNACQDAIGDIAFNGVGEDAPAALTLPANWTGSKPDEEGNWYGGKFELVITALPTLFGDGVKGNKFMRNGQMIIRKGEKNYNILGTKVK